MPDEAKKDSMAPEEFEKNHRTVLKIIIATFVFTGAMIYPLLSLQEPDRFATVAWVLGIYQVNLAGVLIYWAFFRKRAGVREDKKVGQGGAEPESLSRFKE